jgi:hypothetical protein
MTIINDKKVSCRNCDNTTLIEFLNLGEQPLSGIFPKPTEKDPQSGLLILAKCDSCNLVQLTHNFPLDLMYGENYGYESSLNKSMAQHLGRKINNIVSRFFSDRKTSVSVLDIGANDGTLLKSIPIGENILVAVDPTLRKFYKSYEQRPDIYTYDSFFDGLSLKKDFPNGFDIITSISMFYDLLDPKKFVNEISINLKKEGVWHTEQSYLFSMLNSNAFDTVCHEHLEYYSLNSIEKILESTDLKVIDVSLNKTNGGSFALTIAKNISDYKVSESVYWLRKYEQAQSLDKELTNFSQRIRNTREQLLELFSLIKENQKVLAGIGASTKGNVLLNYLELTAADISFISDVNPYKHGRVTPGSRIPIISESDFSKSYPDYALVLPWHFQENIVVRESKYMSEGGKLIFPLPHIQIIED